MRDELIKMLEKDNKVYFVEDRKFNSPMTSVRPKDPEAGHSHHDFIPEYFDFSALDRYRKVKTTGATGGLHSPYKGQIQA